MNTKQFYEPIDLEISNYRISSKEISSGYCSRVWEFTENLPFVAPTVPPVETDDTEGIMEHPAEAFDYYAKHGVNLLYAEHKYMGSRATIFINKGEIKITSRGGFPFFKQEESDVVNKIKDEILKHFQYDYILLDAEIMPWAYKGDDLIKRCFLRPGASAKLFNKYSGHTNPNVDKFFVSLDNYIKNTKVEVRVFDILLLANDKGKRQLSDVFFGYHALREETYEKLHWLNGEYVKPVEHYVVSMLCKDGMNKTIERWKEYCATGGEGFVFKTPKAWTLQSNGYLLQPMLKVRGPEYLRLIYGIDYDEPNALALLKQRSCKKKRNQAVQEFEIAEKMLRATANGASLMEIKRLACGSLGMNSVNFKNVDATL